jgi:hypothetical protein
MFRTRASGSHDKKPAIFALGPAIGCSDGHNSMSSTLVGRRNPADFCWRLSPLPAQMIMRLRRLLSSPSLVLSRRDRSSPYLVNFLEPYPKSQAKLSTETKLRSKRKRNLRRLRSSPFWEFRRLDIAIFLEGAEERTTRRGSTLVFG